MHAYDLICDLDFFHRLLHFVAFLSKNTPRPSLYSWHPGNRDSAATKRMGQSAGWAIYMDTA